MDSCYMYAQSNEYADYIASVSASEQNIFDKYNAQCIAPIGNRYLAVYINRDNITFDRASATIYTPRLFVTQDTGAIDSARVTQVRENPFLELYGSGVIVGFIDTGID